MSLVAVPGVVLGAGSQPASPSRPRARESSPHRVAVEEDTGSRWRRWALDAIAALRPGRQRHVPDGMLDLRGPHVDWPDVEARAAEITAGSMLRPTDRAVVAALAAEVDRLRLVLEIERDR